MAVTHRRILHCIPTLGGGGAERQLAYLVSGLTRLGWEVHVALMEGGSNLDRLQSGGGIVHDLREEGLHRFTTFLQMRDVVRRIEPDLIQSWLRQMDLVGGGVALTTGVPWVLAERASGAHYPASLKNALRILLARRASAIVANSEAGDSYWKAHVDDRVPRIVVPNAIPIEEIDVVAVPSDEEIGVKSGTRLILCAARLTEQKNIDKIVSAIRLVHAEVPVTALIFGEGPARDAIERQVAEHALADVIRLPGYVPTLWKWMKRADVFVSVSSYEGRPNTVLEAMGCGCPLVVSDIAEHREFLTDDEAMFVDAETPSHIANGIRDALVHADAARVRARRARARVAGWTVSAMADAYAHVYRALLDGTISRGGPRSAGHSRASLFVM